MIGKQNVLWKNETKNKYKKLVEWESPSCIEHDRHLRKLSFLS